MGMQGRYAPIPEIIRKRARAVRSWLYARQEKEIVVVTHGAFLHYLTEDWEDSWTGWANTEYRTYHIMAATDTHGAEDFYRRDDAILLETTESRQRCGKSVPGPSSEEQDVLYNTAQKRWKHQGGNVEMKYTMYDTTGAAMPVSTLTKLDAATRYGLSARDLRTIDLPSNGFPHILVRESTVLIHMFDLRLLMQADRVLLFHLEETPNREPDTISLVFRRDLAGKLRGDQGLGVSVKLPYELRVLEAVLAAVASTLEAEFVLAKNQVTRTLGMVDKEEGEVHSQLRTLLELVRTLAGIEKRARQVRSAVQELLNTDEDMADMYLSDKRAGKPHEPQDHQDVEYLLEAYYKASDAVVQEAASLMGAIQQTEESMQSILDVRRNQIMVLEAKIEIVMLGLSVATLVAGWYGMNVINNLEESAVAFGALVSFCLLGIAVISRYGFYRLRRIQRMHMQE
ncbi:hypothetical protein BBP40_000443 [Aspergillus hancockii]|nr:hypothetical protein BBP40_000443 [Aspergillus hancockii]